MNILWAMVLYTVGGYLLMLAWEHSWLAALATWACLAPLTLIGCD